MKHALITSLLFLACIPAYAGTAKRLTVEDLSSKCRIVFTEIDASTSKTEIQDRTICVALLRGFVDGLSMAGMLCKEDFDTEGLALFYLNSARKTEKQDGDWMGPMFGGLTREGYFCPGAIEQMVQNILFENCLKNAQPGEECERP